MRKMYISNVYKGLECLDEGMKEQHPENKFTARFKKRFLKLKLKNKCLKKYKYFSWFAKQGKLKVVLTDNNLWCTYITAIKNKEYVH